MFRLWLKQKYIDLGVSKIVCYDKNIFLNVIIYICIIGLIVLNI